MPLALASEAPPPAFGFYWEMVHDRSGQVVGDGFSRAEPPRLLPHPGYSYRLTRLLGSPATERVSCSPMPAA